MTVEPTARSASHHGGVQAEAVDAGYLQSAGCAPAPPAGCCWPASAWPRSSRATTPGGTSAWRRAASAGCSSPSSSWRSCTRRWCSGWPSSARRCRPPAAGTRSRAGHSGRGAATRPGWPCSSSTRSHPPRSPPSSAPTSSPSACSASPTAGGSTSPPTRCSSACTCSASVRRSRSCWPSPRSRSPGWCSTWSARSPPSTRRTCSTSPPPTPPAPRTSCRRAGWVSGPPSRSPSGSSSPWSACRWPPRRPATPPARCPGASSRR